MKARYRAENCHGDHCGHSHAAPARAEACAQRLNRARVFRSEPKFRVGFIATAKRKRG